MRYRRNARLRLVDFIQNIIQKCHEESRDAGGCVRRRYPRGQVAIIGVGESAYYKRGGSRYPEFVLALQAILAACADAGLDPKDIDGFASFHAERTDPVRLAAALGIRELRHTSLQWGGGGGGGSAALGNAAAAIAAGS